LTLFLFISLLTDYYPFGAEMEGREPVATHPYRYGFNGKEDDNEVKGDGNQVDFGERIYDSRLGRFLSIDPLARKLPWNSPYDFAENRPIDGIDNNGEGFLPVTWRFWEVKR
jgi:RHS repeat-associated protein